MTADKPITMQQLARDILSLSAAAGTPEAFWHYDHRILRACATLRISSDEALGRAYRGTWNLDSEDIRAEQECEQ